MKNKSKFVPVDKDELMKAFGPEMMNFLAEGLHGSVQGDSIAPTDDKTKTKPKLDIDVRPKRRTY